jgi:chromosome segregation ATPase
LAEAQRSLAASISQLRDQLSELQRSLNADRDEFRQNRDLVQAGLDQAKGMREEVRGLYVESSGLKGDIAQVGKQVEGLETSLGNFRLSTGIVVAVVIVLQIVLVGLMFRGRG